MSVACNIITCLGCERRGKPVAGIAPCTVNGRHYIENAEENACPERRFKPCPQGANVPLPKGPLPRDQWPLTARIVAKLATAEDQGVGDTIARVIDPLGGEIYKRWHRRITGRDCGCNDARARLNALYPYVDWQS